MHAMMNLYKNLFQKWDQYWFSQEPVIGIAFYRIFFGIGVLIYHFPRLFFVSDLYTSAGFMWPQQPILWKPIALIAPLSVGIAYGCNIALILAAISFVLGYRTRLSAGIIFIIHTYLVLLENFSTNSIAAFISIFALLFIFSPAGEFLSLDAKKKYGTPIPAAVPVASGTVRKVMVWQIALIYIGNALMKLAYGLKVWITGDIIIWALQDTQWSQHWAHAIVSSIQIPLRVLIILGFVQFIFLGVGLLFSKTRPYAIVF